MLTVLVENLETKVQRNFITFLNENDLNLNKKFKHIEKVSKLNLYVHTNLNTFFSKFFLSKFIEKDISNSEIQFFINLNKIDKKYLDCIYDNFDEFYIQTLSQEYQKQLIYYFDKFVFIYYQNRYTFLKQYNLDSVKNFDELKTFILKVKIVLENT